MSADPPGSRAHELAVAIAARGSRPNHMPMLRLKVAPPRFLRGFSAPSRQDGSAAGESRRRGKVDMGSLTQFLDAETLLHGFGPWALAGIAIIVFIESGFLFPFLPGDSLLVTAAILRASLGLPLWQIVAVAMAAAIAGDQAGFWLGRRFGRRLFTDDARILKTSRLEEAERFFERRGPLALVLGRFVPIVRTYVPVAAGTADMHYSRFIRWNVLGSITWVGLMTGVGVFLGRIPGIAHSIDAIMLIVIGVSMLPIVVSAVTKMRRPAKAGA